MLARGGEVVLLHGKRWTKAEDSRLSVMWDLGIGLTVMAADIGRTEIALLGRAAHVGLKTGVPDGFESLWASAVRTGFDNTGCLRRVLRWAGVVIHGTRSERRCRGVNRRHYVEPSEVDAAMNLWLSTETLHGAARTRGIRANTLRRWLLCCGAIEERTGPKTHRRVPTEVIDRVVAQHRTKETA